VKVPALPVGGVHNGVIRMGEVDQVWTNLSEWSLPSLLVAYTMVLSAWVKWTRSGLT
jgi:hypothetical protein